MKTKLAAAEKWWNDIAEYERTHEIAFASPRALLEARRIEAMRKARRPPSLADSKKGGAGGPYGVRTR